MLAMNLFYFVLVKAIVNGKFGGKKELKLPGTCIIKKEVEQIKEIW
jgi:hypothetical protein